MQAIVEFLGNVVGLSEGEKVELRLLAKDTSSMRPYFFKSIERAVQFGLEHTDASHIFFGVAPRKPGSTRGRKEDVDPLSSVWIDLDRKGRTKQTTLERKLDLFLLPPSYVVSTGGGLHAYWLLEDRAEPDAAEETLKSLQTFFKSDHVTDCTRVLRLPGTINHKYTPRRDVIIAKNSPQHRFNLSHISAACKLSTGVCRTIKEGGASSYKSRSERDFAVISEILRAGGDYKLVQKLFTYYPVGDRYIQSGDEYLERTFQSALEYVAASQKPTEDEDESSTFEFVPFQDCYFVGDIKVSTFTLEPLGILEGVEDSLICNVHSRGYVWEKRVFPRSAFSRLDALQRHLTILSWQWLGSDKQVRALLVQLMDQLLKDDDVPKLRATSVIGRHGDAWVSPDRIINVGDSTDLTFVESGRERPTVACPEDLSDEDYRKLLIDVVRLVPSVNRPEATLPMLAWFLAAPQKSKIEKLSEVRFPIMIVFGTRGSGKTSLIERVFQRLVGYVEPRGYDCATTRFVLMTLLGSTNGIPISLKEFRSAESKTVERAFRLAYDQGYDARGRADQTTVTYALTAPIVLDGEDLVGDPAVHERVIAVNLRPEDILPGTPCFETFDAVRNLQLDQFIGRYIRFCLEHGDTLLKGWSNFINRAQSLTRPTILPARIASNYAILFYGLRVFQQFLNTYELNFPIETTTFRESIGYVFETATGRTHLAVDDFIAGVINEVAISGGHELRWRHEPDNGLLWIHLQSAYGWWQKDLRRRGASPIGLPGLKQQLKERRGDGAGQYCGDPVTKSIGKETWYMYPIDLKAASEALDTPYPLGASQILISQGARGE